MPIPLAAICIPALNAAATVGEVVRAALNQSGQGSGLAVHVLDDGSDDDTAAVARAAGAQVIAHERRLGLAHGRNTLLHAVHAQFLVFFDADALPELDCVDRLLQGFDINVGAVGGRAEEAHDSGLADRYRGQVTPQSHGAQPRQDAHLMGLCLAIRREAAQRINGFDDAFTSAGEDLDFTVRLRQAGWLLRYEPGAVVRHLRHDNVCGLLRQSARHAFWAARALSAIDRPALRVYALDTMRHLGTRALVDLRAGRLGLAGVGALVLPTRLASIGLGALAGRPQRALRNKSADRV